MSIQDDIGKKMSIIYNTMKTKLDTVYSVNKEVDTVYSVNKEVNTVTKQIVKTYS
ncbi:hypothetical protein [Methanococcus maripaludis]|nr:hypothetical protein [Methanococcus maripaludis]